METVYKSTLLPLLANSTRNRYEGVIKNYLMPAFGSKCLPRLTPLTLQQYFSGITNSKLSYESRDKIQGDAHVHYSFLRCDLRDSRQEPDARRREASTRREKGTAPSGPYIDPMKFSSLLVLIPEPYATMVHVAAFTGLRPE